MKQYNCALACNALTCKSSMTHAVPQKREEKKKEKKPYVT